MENASQLFDPTLEAERQSRHDEEAVAELYFPTSHREHEEVPGESEYCPLGHDEHMPSPAFENIPSVQFEQARAAVVPAVDFPASHTSQGVVEFAVPLNLPAAQEIQGSIPNSSLYLPFGHTSQERRLNFLPDPLGHSPHMSRSSVDSRPSGHGLHGFAGSAVRRWPAGHDAFVQYMDIGEAI